MRYPKSMANISTYKGTWTQISWRFGQNVLRPEQSNWTLRLNPKRQFLCRRSLTRLTEWKITNLVSRKESTSGLLNSILMLNGRTIFLIGLDLQLTKVTQKWMLCSILLSRFPTLWPISKFLSQWIKPFKAPMDYPVKDSNPTNLAENPNTVRSFLLNLTYPSCFKPTKKKPPSTIW